MSLCFRRCLEHLAIGLIAWAISGQVAATSYTATRPTMAEAQTVCNEWAQAHVTNWNWVITQTCEQGKVTNPDGTGYYWAYVQSSYSVGAAGHNYKVTWTEGTPNNACEGLASPDLYPEPQASYTRSVAAGGSVCIGGCTMAPYGPSVKTTFGGYDFTNGQWRFTGSACPVTPETPPLANASPETQPAQQCRPAASGQTFCVTADGRNCYSTSSGKQICWRPDQTGKQYDGAMIQQRNTGASPAATPTVSGTTVSQTGSPTTNTVTSGTTTITYTTTNYTVANGSSPGLTNDAQSATANSASGGNCNQSYICSGDSIQCAQLEQTRKAACATENQTKGISGGQTCAVNDQPTCTGACNAYSFAMVTNAWKTRCKTESIETYISQLGTSGNAETTEAVNSLAQTVAESAIGSGQGTPDGQDDVSLGEAGTAAGNGHGEEITHGEDGLDQSGFGWSRTCPDLPAIEFNGATFDLDLTWLCLAGEVFSFLLLAFVGLFCLRYIVGGV